MKPGRKKMLAAFGLIAVAAVFLVCRSVAFPANTNAYAETTGGLGARQLSLAEDLIRTETAGLTRNEESGLEYYHSQAATGEKNRVYVMWWVVASGGPQYSGLGNLLTPWSKPLPAYGVAVYVDLGFHSFRTRHGKMLGRFFDEQDLTALRAVCYFREREGAVWKPVGEIENERLLALIPEERKRSIREGVYNAVYFDGAGP